MSANCEHRLTTERWLQCWLFFPWTYFKQKKDCPLFTFSNWLLHFLAAVSTFLSKTVSILSFPLLEFFLFVKLFFGPGSDISHHSCLLCRRFISVAACISQVFEPRLWTAELADDDDVDNNVNVRRCSHRKKRKQKSWNICVLLRVWWRWPNDWFLCCDALKSSFLLKNDG